jgi:glycosyltransferase involved in cell wall biosynthesis
MKILIITSIDYFSRTHQRTHDLVEFLTEKYDVVVLHNKMLVEEIKSPILLNLISGLHSMLRKPTYLESARIHGKNTQFIGIKQIYHSNFESIRFISRPMKKVLSLVQPLLQIFFIFWPTILFFIVQRHKQFDVCFSQGPWAGATALLLKKLKVVKKIVYEDLDFYPMYIRINLNTRVGFYIAHWIERNVIKRVALVISIGKMLADMRKIQGARKVNVVTNGFGKHLHNVTPNLSSNTLVYAGTLAPWSGIKDLILSIKFALEKVPNIKLLIVGDGPLRDDLENLVQTLDISRNVVFMGRIPYREISSVFSRASVGAAVFVPSELTKYAVMNKLMDYMGAGLAVLATDYGENSKLVKLADVGVCVKHNPKAIAQGIIALLTDKIALRQYSRNAKIFTKNKDWDSLFKMEMKYVNEYLES